MIKFDEQIEATERLGQGEYNVHEINAFGQHTQGVDFDAFAARDDVIGPNGERSNRDLGIERMFVLDYGEELDVNAIASKDSKQIRKKTVIVPVLYREVKIGLYNHSI